MIEAHADSMAASTAIDPLGAAGRCPRRAEGSALS